MTLLLRKTSAQDRIMGWNAIPQPDDDYVIIDDEVMVGRIYREVINGEPKWRWFLQTVPATPPKTGAVDTLDEAKAAFERRYGEAKR
jgi:hypothetical protein